MAKFNSYAGVATAPMVDLAQIEETLKPSIGRVPNEPPTHILGWLTEIMQWGELDVLRMVGLDAYMLLRYHTICYKLALFMSFWGMLILIPVYSTEPADTEWGRYTLSNVAHSEGNSKGRLWLAAIFSYIFSAYFCQLLHAEYNNFSVRRLQYLVQADPDSPMSDPDTPQQKYFTIMIERIPSHLRSKAGLEKFFENLFPGEVYNVEVALDLSELNSLCDKRRAVRYKLEKAIASYEATGLRPAVYVAVNGVGFDLLADDGGFFARLQQLIDPEAFGYQSFDSINYYTNKLIELNKKVAELQHINYEAAKKSDITLQKKIQMRHDTRAAAFVETMSQTGAQMAGKIQSEASRTSLDTLFFGPPPQDYKRVVETEMLKVEVLHDKVVGDSIGQGTEVLSMRGRELTPRPTSMTQGQYASLPGPTPANNEFGAVEEEMYEYKDTGDERDSDLDAGAVRNPLHPSAGSFPTETIYNFDRQERNLNHNPRIFKGWKSPRNDYEVVTNDKGLTVFNPIHPSTSADKQDSSLPTLTAAQHTNLPQPSQILESHSSKKSKLTQNTGSDLLSPFGDAARTVLSDENVKAAQYAAKTGVKQATKASRFGWMQAKLAGSGAFRGLMEIERSFEMLVMGAYYKYSTTAFVTFNSRITESICHQMMLSHDAMEIQHAPNPKDVIWENVAIPRSQVKIRSFIVNCGLVVGSLFWSSLVNWVNSLGHDLGFSQFVQGYFSVIVMLVFLLILPFIFDFLARNYEGLKVEGEIQNSIMTRYFYYQLVNIYVTVGFGVDDIVSQIVKIVSDPHILIEILGEAVPSVSLYFTSLVIVKIFVAVPFEMIRFWQLSTITYMRNFMDRRKCTRRDLKTGAFYSWPMLYGWIYPQLMMVLMIQVTYACIAPFLMPFCALFFVFAYVMYKYQLLFVYINDNQSGGYMWYAVFSHSLIALLFASFALLGYLALDLNSTYFAGPFFFLCPLPFCILYFWSYCEAKFKNQSLNLSLAFAKELDYRNKERKAAGRSVPHDTFSAELYRQPSLTEKPVYPEPYRLDGTSAFEANLVELGIRHGRNRAGSVSMDIDEHIDEDEMDSEILADYFEHFVVPLAHSENAISDVQSGGAGNTDPQPRRVTVSTTGQSHLNHDGSQHSSPPRTRFSSADGSIQYTAGEAVKTSTRRPIFDEPEIDAT